MASVLFVCRLAEVVQRAQADADKPYKAEVGKQAKADAPDAGASEGMQRGQAAADKAKQAEAAQESERVLAEQRRNLELIAQCVVPCVHPQSYH